MPKQVELDPAVCDDCPLVRATNAAWAEYELFSTSAELDNYQLPGYERSPEPNKHMKAVVGIYEQQMEGYNEILEKLSEWVVSHGCPGAHVDTPIGTFCGVEGKLRELGVVVPEY